MTFFQHFKFQVGYLFFPRFVVCRVCQGVSTRGVYRHGTTAYPPNQNQVSATPMYPLALVLGVWGPFFQVESLIAPMTAPDPRLNRDEEG